ncbi:MULTISPECIES: type II toxin-antitoxin system Phd/YefM family antitoxin [Lactobacillus]|uniref:Antitoxin n=2 Tax=Lactobacillus johnsonii TaxID=33959 RepID=A0A9X4X9A1_LACJH|nr:MULTISPECIES: type II toxin-antitoxin system Phd/YefM family antitoxin [Lactobacillus]AHA97848.1 prevent-host-death protein [Lactobacillus johnsonii N6.2]MTE03587.1 type II toxin-antitoxin system Phd/YefM family antitoxin [Lactobacillus johnsonii]
MEEPKNIKAVTVRDLRSNFKSIADEINDYDTTVIVARPKNKNVVIISQKEYDSWQETSYLLGTEANRNALMKAKKSFESNTSKNKLLTPEEFEELSKND